MFVPYLEQNKTLTPDDEKLYAEIMATESDWFAPAEEEKQTPHYTVELTSDAFADPFIIRDNTVPDGQDGQYYDVDGIYQTFETEEEAQEYLNDMSKYNNVNEIKKTRLAYDNITVQLSKKNTRFQYKLIKKGGRASEFENAIEWLCLSGIVSQVYKVEQIKKPLENYRDIDAFKIYVSDLGLLCAKKDLAANDVLYMVEELNDFKGGMAENYVDVQLTINGYKTYYWESERGAEIDFVIQRDGQLIPIEVKSADNTRAKSLKVYMETYKPAYAIKLSAKNFGFEDNKKTVPLYAAFCI